MRNLLNLEGRIAAMGIDQENLAKEDYTGFGDNKEFAGAAQSWEDFALLRPMGARENSMKIPKKYIRCGTKGDGNVWLRSISSRASQQGLK